MSIEEFWKAPAFVRIVCATAHGGYYVHDIRCTEKQYYRILGAAQNIAEIENLCGSSGHYASERVEPEEAVNKWHGDQR